MNPETDQRTLETIPFHFHENAVRAVEIDDEPWFVVKDVCDAMEIKNSRDVLIRLDEDEKGVAQIYTLGGKQNMNIVNEAGVYSLVLRSDKPKAREFKRWLTHEVLPQIRNTGRFEVPEDADDVINSAELARIVGVTPETICKYGKRIGVKSGVGRWGTIYTFSQARVIVEIGHGKSGKAILDEVSAKLNEYFKGSTSASVKHELTQSDIVRLIENQNRLIEMTLKILEKKN